MCLQIALKCSIVLQFLSKYQHKILPLRWAHLVKHCCLPSKAPIAQGTKHRWVYWFTQLTFIECLLSAKHGMGRKMVILVGRSMLFPGISCSFYFCRSRIHIQRLCAETYSGGSRLIKSYQTLFKSNSWTGFNNLQFQELTSSLPLAHLYNKNLVILTS